MTEEEYFRKHYPDYCYGDRLLSPYWDFFQDGVEFGERQSEKKIEELKSELTKKADTNHSLVEQMADLESENAELRAKYLSATDEGTSWATLKSLERKNEQLKQQIEKLKADLNEAIEDANRWEETETFSVLNRIYNDNFEVTTGVSKIKEIEK